MRVAVDVRELTGRPTGVGRYIAQLLAAWDDLPDAAQHEFILCAPQPPALPHTSRLRVSVLLAPGHGTRWQQFALPRLLRQARAHVLFAPAYVAPLLTRTPIVLSVHDVSFAAHPDWFAWREGTRLRLGARLSARKAVRILTFSEFSRREIVRYLGVDARKVLVTYHGVTALADTAPPPAALHTRGTRDVLFVGSIFNRRHVPELIDGFSQLATRHPDVRLEIVGHNRTRPYVDVDALAARSPAAARIAIRSYVPDAELAACYRRAAAFVFLSEYEGFGMTPVEGLAAGVPPVVLDTEVAREIYGGAAMYVPRPDPSLIAGALERVLFDTRERDRLLTAARTTLARYSWRDCAQRTLHALLASA